MTGIRHAALLSALVFGALALTACEKDQPDPGYPQQPYPQPLGPPAELIAGGVTMAEIPPDNFSAYPDPSVQFQGGPSADCGLTGRKNIVDTYGGAARHGGGSLSGKDASKVDRSGAYFSRYVARQIVSQGIARRAEVQVAYAIGVAEPVSLVSHQMIAN